MIPIAGTFQKMQRIVRDMSRKLGKDVEFVTVGEDTEVDKNIVDHLSDPLMHLIRNAMDHGVEPEEERIKKGKAPKARITLTAHNTGGDVMISVSDDGGGINKSKIIKKARDQGLITKLESELTDKEIFALLLLPGFSTNDQVTEFSGRGVGMDVVKQNIEEVGGSISIKSIEGEGTTMTIVIPLTLAIADAMELSVGNSIYTLPTVSIKESFRAKEEDIILDNDGNEMIMIRGNVYPIIRLYSLLKIETSVKKLEEGILIMIEGDNKAACIFADKLLGEQQVVVKPMPKYLLNYAIKESGIEGCTIRGDGSISLILSAKGVISRII
jgi:two-component system chemotaxis sensor kinase CheA